MQEGLQRLYLSINDIINNFSIFESYLCILTGKDNRLISRSETVKYF